MSKAHTVYSVFFGVVKSLQNTVKFYLTEDLVERENLINSGIKIDLLSLFEALPGLQLFC